MTRISTRIGKALLALPWLLAWAAEASSEDWPQLGNNPQHTGYSAEKLKPPLRLAWNVQFQPERLYPAVQPVIAAGRIFLGTESGNLYAHSAADGKRLWKFPAAEKERVGPVMHSAAVEQGRVFFASMDGCLYALAAESGRPLWKFDSRMRTGFSTATLAAEGKVLAANRGGTLFALRQSDGTPAWKAALGCPLLQSPAYHQGRVYVAGMDMRLRALDLATGNVLWQTEPIPGLALKDYWPLVTKGLVIVRPMGGWETFAFEEKSGRPVELVLPGGITMNGAVAPPCVDGQGRLVTATADRRPAAGGQWIGGGVWGRFDLENRNMEIISEGKPRGGGRGNRDENMIASAAASLIFVMHCQEGNAQFTGCYDLDTRTWTPIGAGPWQNMTSNTQGGGASQAAIAGGALYHVSLHGLRCFRGGP